MRSLIWGVILGCYLNQLFLIHLYLFMGIEIVAAIYDHLKVNKN